MSRDPRRAYRVVDDFEDELCHYTGAPFAVAVDSCTNALYLSLMYSYAQFGIKAREMGIDLSHTLEMPSRTYVGVLQAARNASWRVVFDDRDWKDAYRLPPTNVVDSARSIRRDMYEPGDLTCLSFHAAKQLPLGRGGAILTDDQTAYDFFRRSRADGRAPGDVDPYARFPGWHMYMPPDTAARGLWILSRWVDAGYDPPPLLAEDYPDLSLLDGR